MVLIFFYWGIPIANNKVNCIEEDRNGFIWFGTNEGLNLYAGYSLKVYKQIEGDSTTITRI